MRRLSSVVGSTAFFFAAPCVVAGPLPWLLSRWHLRGSVWWLPARVVGTALALVGLVVLVRTFARFVVEGRGTPAPVAPTETLVIGGEYRYVRNPMYVAVEALIVGQALLFGSVSVLGYAALSWAVMAAFVRWYEEPTLTARFGEQYLRYRGSVPAWLPRLRPWSG
jgi:protein-S-isoprenylcysteine O-methyltransferase Ste14